VPGRQHTFPAPGEMVCFTPCFVLDPLQPMSEGVGPNLRCLAFCMRRQERSLAAGTETPANCLSAARSSCAPKQRMWPVLGVGRQMDQLGV